MAVFTPDQIERINHQSFDILEKVGLKLENESVQE